jgi:hypothetical protein
VRAPALGVVGTSRSHAAGGRGDIWLLGQLCALIETPGAETLILARSGVQDLDSGPIAAATHNELTKNK